MINRSRLRTVERSAAFEQPARLRRLPLIIFLLGWVVAGTPVHADRADGTRSEALPVAASPALQLVESVPIETELDHPDIPDAHLVWLEMIGLATESIDFAEFYASNSPDSRLEKVIVAVEEAARRGVHVRFLAEKSFSAKYPETLDRLAAQDNIRVQRYDGALAKGGILHAKYFLVDGRDAFLGSQNFDWRSLVHIQELGLRIREPHLVSALAEVFEFDWAMASGTEAPVSGRASAPRFPVSLPVPVPVPGPVAGAGASASAGAAAGTDTDTDKGTRAAAGDTLRITPAFSPRGLLPDESLWDLPQIVALLDAATDRIRVQLLSYRAIGRDGAYFDTLESALRRAASRGVTVQLLLSDWSKRRDSIVGLQSLQVLPGIEVRLATIPPWSGGFVPYARVIHAKYLVVDGRRAWLGTSNWASSYFHRSRNVGLVIEGGDVPATLDRFFEDGWSGPYSATVDPCAEYEPPRIGR